MQCLEKDRTLRYRNVSELAVALLPYGPARARLSVERIAGILHAEGLSDESSGALSSPRSTCFAGRKDRSRPWAERLRKRAGRSSSIERSQGCALERIGALFVAGLVAGAVLMRHPSAETIVSQPTLPVVATLPAGTVPSVTPSSVPPLPSEPPPFATPAATLDAVANPPPAVTRVNHANPTSPVKRNPPASSPASAAANRANAPSPVSAPPAPSPQAPPRAESTPDPLQNLQMKN